MFIRTVSEEWQAGDWGFWEPQRAELLREKPGIDRRTLERWRQWWLEDFVQSRFWRAARSRFPARFCEATLPLSLCESCDEHARQSEEEQRGDPRLDLLHFLSPLRSSPPPS